MLAGKGQDLTNSAKKIAAIAVLCSFAVTLVLGVALAAGSRTAGISEPELVTVLLPDWSTFDHTAKEWIFTALPLQVGRGNWQVRLKDAAIRETGMKIEHGEQEWRDALVYGDSAREARELEDTLTLRLRNLQGQISAAEQSGLERGLQQAYNRIRTKDPQGKNVFGIRLPAQPVVPGEPYLLDLTFEAREKTGSASLRRFTVTKQVWPVVLPPSISDNSTWFRADLHLHSRYSDGGDARHLYAVRDVFLANRGYRIAYMTDHVGQDTSPRQHLSRFQCICPPQGQCFLHFQSHGVIVNVTHSPCTVANTWSCYVTNTQRVSIPTGVSFFPGLELSARPTPPPAGVVSADGEGHALGYGITDFPRVWGGRNVFDLSHGPQDVINMLAQNNIGQPSSAGIAHPTSDWLVIRYDWPWLGHLNPADPTRVTTHYRGMELMSGAQTNFSLTSDPMRKWRRENRWLVHSATGRPVFTQRWFPSVRTGSDLDPWNNSKYYTHILVPVTEAQWNDSARTWANRRQMVDNALHNGRTIASLRGSWGRVAINGLLPGEIRSGWATGSTLNMELRLIPSVNGTAQVRLFQGDRADADIANNLLPTPIFSEDIPVTAGTEVTRVFTRTFPGGDQYYWLFVDIRGVGSNDVIYTTPIFITSNP